MSPQASTVVIIGAGPAGLTAALELTRHGVRPTVLEASDAVGGISRTVEREGWRFDLGGHRFFTKVPEVEQLWHEILPDGEFLLRPRLSRIHYRGRLFDYPLKPLNALRGLGLLEAVRCLLSYLWVRVRPPRDQSSFEGWVAARFGWRLYRIFFKTYTEKVWGCPATEIQADWAAQRIKNLSLLTAVTNALWPRGGTDVTSLIEEFQYPRFGPGQMWETARDHVTRDGGRVLTDEPVVRIHRGARLGVETASGKTFVAEEVISSMPIGELVLALDPPAPEGVRAAAEDLRHRDFLTVALVVPEAHGFPDNWIYIHEPGVRVGRIQNFGSWSPHLVKDGRTCLGLEFFVTEGDELWCAPDEDLVALAEQELQRLGLVPAGVVERGFVVRVDDAYPVYDEHYARNVEVLRTWLDAEVPHVHPVGRNGMHRYNNQDHSMVTALIAARNVLAGERLADPWEVNVDDDYHEESRTGRDAPVIPRAARLPAA